ncbi:MAG: hypothetical protein AAF670_19015, partial [Planctomycetota bacterium]
PHLYHEKLDLVWSSNDVSMRSSDLGEVAWIAALAEAHGRTAEMAIRCLGLHHPRGCNVLSATRSDLGEVGDCRRVLRTRFRVSSAVLPNAER